MRKIETLLQRGGKPFRALPALTPGMEWVLDNEGIPTEKYDGTACCIHGGKFFKRLKVKEGGPKPPGWMHWRTQAGLEDPAESGHGWAPVGDGNEDAHHREGWAWLPEGLTRDGTWELVGPAVQRNPYNLNGHHLWEHGSSPLALYLTPSSYGAHEHLRLWLEQHTIEGIVWHHPDGRMAKIKRSDFGLPWPV